MCVLCLVYMYLVCFCVSGAFELEGLFSTRQESYCSGSRKSRLARLLSYQIRFGRGYDIMIFFVIWQSRNQSCVFQHAILGCLRITYFGWVSCSLFPVAYRTNPNLRKKIAVGKSSPNATFELGWPWIEEFVGFVTILSKVDYTFSNTT